MRFNPKGDNQAITYPLNFRESQRKFILCSRVTTAACNCQKSLNILNAYQGDHAVFLHCSQLAASHFIMFDVYLPTDTIMNTIFLLYS